MPSTVGSNGSPVCRSRPTTLPSACSSWSKIWRVGEQYTYNIQTYLQSYNHILNVEPAVLSQCLRDNKKGIGKSLNTHLDTTLCALLHCSTQMCRTRYFKGSSARDQCFILNGILHSTETVTKSILDLLYSVGVWTFDEKRDRFGVFNFLDECELLLSESMFINESSPTQNWRHKVIYGILCSTATS